MTEQMSDLVGLRITGEPNNPALKGGGLVMPHVTEGSELTLYGMRSDFEGAIVLSFVRIPVENFPGMETGGKIYRNTEMTPIRVSIPEGSEIVDFDLRWTLDGRNHLSSALNVYSLAKTEQHGFRILGQ